MRTIIDLPPDQIAALEVLCRRDDVSRAEAIRRIIASHVARQPPAGAQRAFGLWRSRKVDGLAYQERLRREWGNRRSGGQ